jgi:hypothetical protein
MDNEENTGEKFIKPKNIELTLSKEKKQVCRDIVKEINNYGVSQRQKIFLCELIALELEDPNVRDAFIDAVKMARSKLGTELVIEQALKKKLIL